MQRNQFFKLSSSLFLVFCLFSEAYTQNTLAIPPTESGDEIDILMMVGTHQFVEGIETPTWGYNGSFLGPTIILEKGQNVQFTISNYLNEITTLHWHGLDVPANTDGGATFHHHIHPGETSSPAFEILNRAGTYWYHPHPHENTEAHVVRGLAGMIIVQDEEETALNLPRTYGVDDIPLIIQDKTFDTTDTTMMIVETGLSHVMMVNGTLDAHFDAPAQMVRFRALNGSASRHYLLGWSDSTDLIQIASDGGLLERSVSLKRIMIAPGERVEFISSFNGRMGDTLSLMSFAPELPEGAAGQGIVIAPGLPGADSPLNGVVFPIMSVSVVNPTANPVTTMPPDQLSVIPQMPDTTNIGLSRILTIKSPNNGAGGPFNFNDDYYDETVMNQVVQFRKTEIWEIRNQTLIGHPFHLHGGYFHMLARNGEAPRINEMGLKDTWYVDRGGSIRIVVRFDNHFDNEVPFMYHCHMLGHEDGIGHEEAGLMGNVLVVDSTYTATREADGISSTSEWLIYPNPSERYFMIKSELEKSTNVRLEVFSLSGKKVLEITEKAYGVFEKTIDLNGHPPGVWLLRLTADGYSYTQKLVLIEG